MPSEVDGVRVSFDAMDETLRLTSLGGLRVGDLVNVERSARFGDEVGGHVVPGAPTGARPGAGAHRRRRVGVARQGAHGVGKRLGVERGHHHAGIGPQGVVGLGAARRDDRQAGLARSDRDLAGDGSAILRGECERGQEQTQRQHQ